MDPSSWINELHALGPNDIQELRIVQPIRKSRAISAPQFEAAKPPRESDNADQLAICAGFARQPDMPFDFRTGID